MSRASKKNPKLKNFLLSPSYLSEEDLEIYIAAELDEMTKYLTQTLKKYQKEEDRWKRIGDGNSKETFEQYFTSTSDDLLGKLISRKGETKTDGGKSNEVNALKTKMDLYEMQYQTFTKEIEKQPKGVFKIKEKANLKKKLKDLESTYLALIKTLRKKLQQLEIGLKESYFQVDTKNAEHSEINAFFNQKNAVVDVIPTTATKINIVLEQISAVDEEIESLKVIKFDSDKYLQNSKCKLKNSVDPYSSNKTVPFNVVEDILNQIERDISYINNEYDGFLDVLLQRKQAMNENYEKLHKLNGFLNILFYKLYEVQWEHRKNKQDLKKEKSRVLSTESLSKDGKSAILSEIERKYNELNSTYNSTYLSLQGQIKEIEEEASAITEIGSIPLIILIRLENGIADTEIEENCSEKNIKDKEISYANTFKKLVNVIKTKYDSLLPKKT